MFLQYFSGYVLLKKSVMFSTGCLSTHFRVVVSRACPTLAAYCQGFLTQVVLVYEVRIRVVRPPHILMFTDYLVYSQLIMEPHTDISAVSPPDDLVSGTDLPAEQVTLLDMIRDLTLLAKQPEWIEIE